MRVVITGGTGLIGRALAAELAPAGYETIVLSRDPRKARGLPEGVRAEFWDGQTGDGQSGDGESGDGESGAGWSRWIDGETAIVHLAGAGIADDRWSEGRKRESRDSRTVSSRAVLAAIREAGAKPRALLQASAVGYYGPRGSERID